MVKSMISNRHCIPMLLAAAFCLAACSKQVLPEEPAVPSDPEVESVAETQEYHISAACTDTRTAVSGSSIVWNSGDELTVAYLHESSLQTAIFEYEGNDSFKGEVSAPDDPSDWYAIYPANAVGEDGTRISLPAENIQQGNGSKAHLAGEAFPLFGKALAVAGSDVPHLQMEQIASVVNFNVTNQEDSPLKVSSIIFSAPVEIAGEFSGKITSGTGWSPVTGKATTTAVLNVTGGEEIASGASASFYMGVMPFSATGNFTITVMAECGGEQIYSTKRVQGKTMEFKAGTIGKINYKFISSVPGKAKDYYVKVTSDPGDANWGGQYIIVNTAKDHAFSTTGNNASTLSVTDEDGRIEATAEVEKAAMTISGGTQNHKQSGQKNLPAYDIMNSEGKYVFFNSAGMRISSSKTENGADYQHTIVLDGSGIQLMSAKNGGNGGSKYYMTYSGSGFTYNGTAANRVLLYKKIDTQDTRSGQAIQFAESRVTWYIGEGSEYQTGATYNLPQFVSGAQTFVTYSSSNPEVAEIAGNSQLRIVGTGITTINATAAESTEYTSASASFTLVIKEPGVIPNLDLGNFDLTDDTVMAYLKEADAKYTDSNWSTVTVVTNYPQGTNAKTYDRPKPVLIPVDEPDGTTVTVAVYNDASRDDEELVRTYTVTGGYAEVYNLIPNDSYWYTVSTGNEELSQGTFTTTGLRRYLTVSNVINESRANNLRDFGGLKVGENHALRYNMLFRGSNMDKTTAEEQAWITGYMGVRMDVDLRAMNTYSQPANRPLDRNLVDYTNGNISNYSDINDAKIQTIFAGIAKTLAKGEACYIHCQVGADRTGYICMLIEAICGVSQKDCSIDYELTSFSCVGTRDRVGKYNNYYFTKGMEFIEGHDGSTFQQKAVNTLLDYGVPQSDIDTIVAAMVE